MRKTVGIVVCVLALILLVSCTDNRYERKVNEAQNLYNEGKNVAAIHTLSEAIYLDSNRYEAYAVRGNLYRQLGKYDLAISDYIKIIQKGVLYYNYPLGILLADIGRGKEAVKYLEDYIKYDDKNAEVYILLAKIYMNIDDYKSAEEIKKIGYEATGDERLNKY